MITLLVIVHLLRIFTIYTVSIIILPYRPLTLHTSYACMRLCQVITICAAYTPADNCSVGLRSWCNTYMYCLQPYRPCLCLFLWQQPYTLPFLKVFIITSPWSEREIWPFLKVAISPKPKKATPTKISVHAFDINHYLHKYFEPIPINLIFYDHEV